MTTSIKPNTRVFTQNTTALPLSITKKEMECKIRSVDATQIEKLAKALVAKVLLRLNLDVIRKGSVAEEYNPDREDNLFALYCNQYDPESKLMKELLPMVVKRITQAFATPDQFLQDGLVICFVGAGGLFDYVKSCDPFLAQRTSSRDNQMKQDWQVGGLAFSLKLIGNLELTREKSEVSFDIQSFKNGALIGCAGATLESREK